MDILLYGAGKNGIRALGELGQENVTAFLDAYRSGDLSGLPIYKPETYSGDRDKALVFVTVAGHYQEIAETLDKNGYSQFMPYQAGRVSSKRRQRLTAGEWGKIYNTSLKHEIANKVREERVSSWSQEVLRLTKVGDRVLEIGCGSGMSTLYLASKGRHAVGLDYSRDSIELLEQTASLLNLDVMAVYADATEELPFEKDSFDLIFQAGLLEHFSQEDRINMLRLWRRYGRRMVSMIPNANSLPYRVGKAIQEENGSWQYGLEMPQGSMQDEFVQAGYKNINEYTIDVESAISFLPEAHYMRVAMERLIHEWPCGDDLCGQGYLLVTIGENC